MEEIMLKIEDVSKMYKLGQIGGTTLRDELQRKVAKLKGKEDPTKRIGAKDYNKGEIFMALNGVSFEVKRGERVGIIGHNGAGKSTLLKLISRVTAPTGGSISMNGRVASMLEVGTGFHGELTGRENIYMNGAILGMTKKEIDAKIEDIIEFSEVRQFIDTPVKRYSSGMYVKLAFSVAAHLDSEILIMDEVLAVGDMAFQKKCLDKMNDVSKRDGRTILYVSHNMNTIRQLCDRVVVLDHGKAVFDGNVEGGIEHYINKIDIFSGYLKLDGCHKVQNTFSPDFVMNSISIKGNKDKAIYTIGESMEFSITYASSRSIDGFTLAIVFYFQDQTPITMMTSKISTIHQTDNGEISVLADISRFAPGKYTFDICSYEVNQFGSTRFHDIIRNGVINIEIVPSEGFNQGREWNHLLWGHIISDKLILRSDGGQTNV